MRLIDDNGENLGVIETSKALQMAYDKDLDLVVVSQNQEPPVCKIMNYGKYKYELEKLKSDTKLQEAKASQIADQKAQEELYLKALEAMRDYSGFKGD